MDNGASLRDRATHERNPQAVSAVPVGIPSARETGWLIEEFVNSRPGWLKAYCHDEAEPFLHSPTYNASEALRFARKCDAEIFLHNLKRLHRGVWDHCFVTDHEWIAS